MINVFEKAKNTGGKIIQNSIRNANKGRSERLKLATAPLGVHPGLWKYLRLLPLLHNLKFTPTH